MTKGLKHCVIIGDPVEHSLSPIIHNAGYIALGISDKYQFTALRVSPKEIKNFIAELRTSDIVGVSCTVPHKELVLPYLDEIDEVATEIGAINSIVNDNGHLKGFNTDWVGAVEPLIKLVDLKNKNVAVLGAGGAARAFVYGLKKSGANVTILNRTLEKAKSLAIQFASEFLPLSDQAKIAQADIICNTTSVGLNDPLSSPIGPNILNSSQIVFDAVYSPQKTKLLKDAESAGSKIIYGSEMLLFQAYEQFKLFTGLEAPEKAMRQAMEENLHE